MVMNSYAISIHDTARIYDGSGPIAIDHSSEEGFFITWTQAGPQFMEISYAQIRL
jgi:hypothetical protein